MQVWQQYCAEYLSRKSSADLDVWVSVKISVLKSAEKMPPLLGDYSTFYNEQLHKKCIRFSHYLHGRSSRIGLRVDALLKHLSTSMYTNVEKTLAVKVLFALK